MRYLLLGGTGFIGANLANALLQDPNNNVVIYSRNKSNSSFFIQNERLTYKQGDFFNETDFSSLVKDVDIVYHMVASSIPANSNIDISRELELITNPTCALLNACAENSVKKVVFISSGGAVYGRDSLPPFNESSPTNPISAYGLQKLVIEKLLYIYSYLHGLDYCIIRLSNPYGPGQDVSKGLGVLTTLIDKGLKKQNVTIYGDGTVSRDFIFIDDAIRGILKIEKYKGDLHIFNLGSGMPLSINELIKAVENSLQTTLRVSYEEPRKADVPSNYLDVSLFTSLFGAPIQIPLNEGITKTAAYLRTAI